METSAWHGMAYYHWHRGMAWHSRWFHDSHGPFPHKASKDSRFQDHDHRQNLAVSLLAALLLLRFSPVRFVSPQFFISHVSAARGQHPGNRSSTTVCFASCAGQRPTESARRRPSVTLALTWVFSLSQGHQEWNRWRGRMNGDAMCYSSLYTVDRSPV